MKILFKNLIEKAKRFFDKIKADKVSEYAAECAYFTILSFVPFIIFFITIIQYLNIDKSSIIFSVQEIFPTTVRELITNIVEEAYSKSAGTISIAIIITLWSAGRGFFNLCKGLRTIYKVEENKPNLFIRIEGTIYTLIFMITLILLLVVRVFGNQIYDLIRLKFEGIGIIISKVLKMRTIIFIACLFIIFLLLYKFIPRHKEKIKSQIVGALIASIGCYIASWIFSIYIDIFKGFSNTYRKSDYYRTDYDVGICVYVYNFNWSRNKFTY